MAEDTQPAITAQALDLVSGLDIGGEAAPAATEKAPAATGKGGAQEPTAGSGDKGARFANPTDAVPKGPAALVGAEDDDEDAGPATYGRVGQKTQAKISTEKEEREAAPSQKKAATKEADAEEDDEGEEQTEAKAAGEWPSDWRERFIKAKDYGDKKDAKGKPLSEKTLNQLKRIRSPEAMIEAYLAAQEKIRSGELRASLSDDATDEEKAKWREDNDIPIEPAKYEVPAVTGAKWYDQDEAPLAAIKEVFHKENITQRQANALLSTYAKMRAGQMENFHEGMRNRDASGREEFEDRMRTEMGRDFKPAMKLANRLLNDQEVFPKGMSDKIRNARMSDGSLLIYDPGFARSLIDLAKKEYGAGGMVSNTEAVAQDNREAELTKLMETDLHSYWNGPRNAKGESPSEELGRILKEKEARKGGRRSAA